MANIAIVGAGMMGSALCWPLIDNQHSVNLVGTPLDDDIIRSVQETGFHLKLARKIPLEIEAHFSHKLEMALEGVDLVVSGVSSFGVTWFADRVGPLLTPTIPVLAVTKGLDILPDGELRPLSEYINDRLPEGVRHKVSLNGVAGPCIAHELAARRQTCVAFYGKDQAMLHSLKEIFHTPYYHIWTSTDVNEISICAALKNGYALAAGIAAGMLEREGQNGLASMYNLQAAVFAQSIQEMRLMIRELGGKEAYVDWLSGAGDLYVTVFGGRTRRLGMLIGEGKSASEAQSIMAGETLESVEIITRAADALVRLERHKKIDPTQFPLLKFLDGVINRNQPASFPLESFFSSQVIQDRLLFGHTGMGVHP